MIVGTVLKDNRTDAEGVLYGDDGENAIMFNKCHVGSEVCEVVKIPWEFLSVTGEVIPIGAIPTKYTIGS